MPYQTPAWRIALGVVISLLLHVAALVFLRLPQPGKVTDQRTWMTEVEVRIVPPPVPEPAADAEAEKRRLAVAPARRPARRVEARKPASTEPTDVAVQPARESALILAPAEPAAAAHFDREAAKAAARDIAAELGPPQAALRPTREEKLARRIQNAARPNCKDGIPGGLLAPLYLLMDKKDSGCKW